MRYRRALAVYFHSHAVVPPFAGRGLYRLPVSQQFILTSTLVRSQSYRSLNMTASERTSDVSPKLRVGVIGTHLCADHGVNWIFCGMRDRSNACARAGAGGNTKKLHIPLLQKIDGVEVVAVANRSLESASRVTQEFGIKKVHRAVVLDLVHYTTQHAF